MKMWCSGNARTCVALNTTSTSEGAGFNTTSSRCDSNVQAPYSQVVQNTCPGFVLDRHKCGLLFDTDLATLSSNRVCISFVCPNECTLMTYVSVVASYPHTLVAWVSAVASYLHTLGSYVADLDQCLPFAPCNVCAVREGV